MDRDNRSPAGATGPRAIEQDGSYEPEAFLWGEVDPALLAKARHQANSAGVPLRQLLFSNDFISRENYIKALASFHGLSFFKEAADLEGFEIDGGDLTNKASAKTGNSGLITLVRDGQEVVVLDILSYSAEVEQQFFAGNRVAGDRLALIPPALAHYLRERINEQARLEQAVMGLERSHPGFCAKGKSNYVQKLVLFCLLALLAGGLARSPIGALYVLGAGLNLLFLYAILLRLYAVMTLGADVDSRTDANDRGGRRADEDLPVYSLLVPLFHEHRVVEPLVQSLLALDYPVERLDIKLIFEHGDEQTWQAARQALQAQGSPGCFELLVVPPGGPQTKPKALNYALATARGRYVVVYDAEDEPEPDQLRKAVQVFARAGGDRTGEGAGGIVKPLACLQAKLNHYNIDQNWLARQFTLEYTALFDGLLPALQRLELPILLGGTSNHFRTDILREIGAWDAYNVTEDADLGIRLMRFGYRCEMLSSTTYEEACCQPRDWVRQRTRWLKGWLQTWLVHMRRPVRLFRSLGARGFAGFQIILGAQVLSLVAHPLFIAFMTYEAWSGHLFARSYGVFGHLFWGLALGNFILGYGVAIWLGFATLRTRGFYRLMPQLLVMPLYWLLISFATFRALVHYISKPFHWEKTEHGLSEKRPHPHKLN
ncbi:MAG: glycosyltransferase [Hyphomicrobiaceae bacterium]|nr:glycosyltransferase [Hyphomicrobiaceae bacterium]